MSLSRVFSHGVQIGWGANCNKHIDRDTPHLGCKVQLTYGQERLSDLQCIGGLMQWLLLGFTVDWAMDRDRAPPWINH